MKYTEWKDKRQKAFNELPIFFAFSNKQFAQEMAARGLSEKDTDKLYSIGHGGFYLRKDAGQIREWVKGEGELSQLMNNEEFATEAFEYEMENHEYAINWQRDWDVCNCFCEKECEYGETKTYVDYLTEQSHANWIPAYEKALATYNKLAIENEWY